MKMFRICGYGSGRGELVSRLAEEFSFRKIGIAAVKGSYKGKVAIADPQPPNQVRLSGEGKGLPGYVKGEALISLSGQGEGTLVSYSGEMQVGGLLAGIGQRMIGGVAKIMLDQFFKNMEKELNPPKG